MGEGRPPGAGLGSTRRRGPRHVLSSSLSNSRGHSRGRFASGRITDTPARQDQAAAFSYHPVGEGGSHEGTNISSATFNRHGVPCRRASAIEKYKRVQWNPFVFLAEAAIMSSAPDSSNMDVVRCDHNHALQGAGVTRHLRPGNIKNMPGGSFGGPCRPCPFQGMACID